MFPLGVLVVFSNKEKLKRVLLNCRLAKPLGYKVDRIGLDFQVEMIILLSYLQDNQVIRRDFREHNSTNLESLSATFTSSGILRMSTS
jgi:hypothetical protein